jgi:uncharacterized protein
LTVPEYSSPGVFIAEFNRGGEQIEGVATSTAAFLGETQRGPQTPTLVTSYSDYQRLFGDAFSGDKFMPDAVKLFFDNGGQHCYVTRIVGEGAGTAVVTHSGYTFSATGPGSDYNQVWLRIRAGSTKDTTGNPIGFRLTVYYWANTQDVPADETALDSGLPASVVEDFDDISPDPDSASNIAKILNDGNSAFVTVLVTGSDGTATMPAVGAVRLPLVSDGSAVDAAAYDRDSDEADLRTGLSALSPDRSRSVAVVYAPGAPYEVGRMVVAHCERDKFRFAVLDAQKGLAVPATFDAVSSVGNSSQAAVYGPWIWISDPSNGGRRLVPPGGAICGIYARTDNSRGVFKAPANEAVMGAIDLEYDVTPRVQDGFNGAGINAIRRFSGRGILVWGARTLSSDPLWKYVNMRRLFLFLEASIYNSTQWVVFEPNTARLWERVRQTVTAFLHTQWVEGALMGARASDAFAVYVGRETMTEDDILNGRLIIQIGVAPLLPAEFVVLRICQRTQESRA